MTVRTRTGDSGDVNLQGLISNSDLVIIGPQEFASDRVLSTIRTKPALLISDGPVPPYTPQGWFVFTGNEDLTRLAAVVVEG